MAIPEIAFIDQNDSSGKDLPILPSSESKGDLDLKRDVGEKLIPEDTLTKTTKRVVVSNASKYGSRIFVPLYVNGKESKFLIDFGADVTIVNSKFLERRTL